MTDLTNQQFGCLTVLERDKERRGNKSYWKARCNICGAISSVRTDNLKRNPEHCIHCRYPTLAGKTFGYLTVVSLAGSDGSHRTYNCKCTCGKEVHVPSTHLISGNTKSCGCKTRQMIAEAHQGKLSVRRENLAGQQFGELTAIKPLGNRLWLCKCSCGEYTEVRACDLKDGHTVSCGHVKSKGELAISKFLVEHQIEHKKEYIFDDLPNRRFDFAIFDPQHQLYCVIEYMGIQHYDYRTGGWNTKENYEAGVQRDEQKRDYCRANNIKLIEIPYWEYDNIDSILAELVEI